MAAASKVFAVITTYPYQVVRSRLQVHILNEIVGVEITVSFDQIRSVQQGMKLNIAV
jgi:hypothetical protein